LLNEALKLLASADRAQIVIEELTSRLFISEFRMVAKASATAPASLAILAAIRRAWSPLP
jgi:hypothetical protein